MEVPLFCIYFYTTSCYNEKERFRKTNQRRDYDELRKI